MFVPVAAIRASTRQWAHRIIQRNNYLSTTTSSSTRNSWLNLEGQVAIVTGAASGIGAAVAATLREQNCHLVLADLGSTSSNSIVETVNENDGAPRIRYQTCDVTDPQQVQQLVCAADALAAAVSPDQPRASILVNCAGITRDALLQDMTLEAFDEVINVNLRGTYLTCRAFLDPSRRKNIDRKEPPIMNKLSIVNIGSVVSEWGNVGQVNYAASKGGVVGLTRAIAKEMTFRGEIVGRCNAVLPGFISTQMTDAVPSKIQSEIIMEDEPGIYVVPEAEVVYEAEIDTSKPL